MAARVWISKLLDIFMMYMLYYVFLNAENGVMMANAQCREDLKTNGACGDNNCNTRVGPCHDKYGNNLLFASCRFGGPNNICECTFKCWTACRRWADHNNNNKKKQIKAFTSASLLLCVTVNLLECSKPLLLFFFFF